MGGQSGDTRYWSLGYRPSPPPHIRHGTTYDAREQITETGLVPDHSTLNTTTHTKTDNEKQKGGIMYDGSAEKQNTAIGGNKAGE